MKNELLNYLITFSVPLNLKAKTPLSYLQNKNKLICFFLFQIVSRLYAKDGLEFLQRIRGDTTIFPRTSQGLSQGRVVLSAAAA